MYIEGLGTKQDILRAERFYKFAEKSGCTDPEYLFWIHFGAALRQAAIPEKLKESMKQRWSDLGNARTCMYLIREKNYTPVCSAGHDDSSICDRRPAEFFSRFKYNKDYAEYYRNDGNRNGAREVSFYVPRQDGNRCYWDVLRFQYK